MKWIKPLRKLSDSSFSFTSRRTATQLKRPLLSHQIMLSSITARGFSGLLQRGQTLRMFGTLPEMHGTTILSVRRGGKLCMIGDGQVSLGSIVVKPNAIKGESQFLFPFLSLRKQL